MSQISQWRSLLNFLICGVWSSMSQMRQRRSLLEFFINFVVCDHPCHRWDNGTDYRLLHVHLEPRLNPWTRKADSANEQFATYDPPMMDLKRVTELNFFFYLHFLAMPTFWHFSYSMSFCSRMLSKDTPHFVILGYCAFCISSWYWWFSL